MGDPRKTSLLIEVMYLSSPLDAEDECAPEPEPKKRRKKARRHEKKSVLHASVIIRPSIEDTQYYRTCALDVNVHGHIEDSELDNYVSRKVWEGYSYVNGTDVVDYNINRHDRVVLDLSGDMDHNLNVIEVTNLFSRDRLLSNLVRELNMTALANHLLVYNWEETKKNGFINKRGNGQFSHGINHVDMTNSTSIPGMNTANRHRKVQRMNGVEEGDMNLEMSLVKRQCLVTKISDRVSEINGTNKVFSDAERSRWAAEDAVRLGVPTELLRGEAGAVIYNGPLPEVCEGQHSAICRMHTDGNDPRDGANETICVSQTVPLDFPWRQTDICGRVALNQFQKNCNGCTSDKLKVNKRILDDVRAYLRDHGIDSTDSDFGTGAGVDWVGKQMQVESELNAVGNIDNMHDLDKFATLAADPCKDCHTSWFCDFIFEHVIPDWGYDDILLKEIIMARALTSSSVGWRAGTIMALHAMRAEKGNVCTNFIDHFIREMRMKYDSVAHSFGVEPRCQVSSSASISHHELYMSLRNMMMNERRANDEDCVTDELLRDLSSGPFDNRGRQLGGIMKAGDLTVQDILSISTKVGLISRTDHVRRVSVAKGTATWARLLEMGVRDEIHMRELVVYLATELNIPDFSVIENLLCETYRLKDGVDTIRLGQPLFYVGADGSVVRVSATGQRSIINFDSLYGMEGVFRYNPMVRWWNISPDSPERILGRDRDIILTTRAKILKQQG